MTDLQQRIESKCEKIPGGCWEWTAGTRGVGYGAIKLNGKVIDAHRASYIAFKGDIPAGRVVMHSCDNRMCVNPDHLSIGTYRDNARDAADKGRMQGRPTRATPLTDEERQEIFRRYDGGVSERVLTHQFSIAPSSLKRILRQRPATASLEQ